MSDTDRMAHWMRRLRLRHLEVLVCIAEAGSLTAAADALDASQPSVSQWLMDIESALGVRLFIRGRQLAPTEFLEPALWHARRMLNDSRRLEAELAAIGAGSAGTVRIGAMHVAGPKLMPSAILRIKALVPQTRIQLIEDIAAGLWPRFERNELDILVTRLDERSFGRGLKCEPLHDNPHCVMARSGHPLTKVRAPTWVQAAAYPWILPPAQTPLRAAIDATFIAAGLAPPQAWLESVAMTTNQAILRDTDSLVVVSTEVAQHFLAARTARILALRLTTDVGPVGMVWHDPEPSSAVGRALEAIRQAARALAERG